jgi:hypothetical protein
MRRTGADRLLPVIRNSGAPDGSRSAPPSAQGTRSVSHDARADQRRSVTGSRVRTQTHYPVCASIAGALRVLAATKMAAGGMA